MQEGRTLRLLFGDFDVESSPGCRNGSVVITGKSGERRLGELAYDGVLVLADLRNSQHFTRIPADRF